MSLVFYYLLWNTSVKCAVKQRLILVVVVVVVIVEGCG